MNNEKYIKTVKFISDGGRDTMNLTLGKEYECVLKMKENAERILLLNDINLVNFYEMPYFEIIDRDSNHGFTVECKDCGEKVDFEEFIENKICTKCGQAL